MMASHEVWDENDAVVIGLDDVKEYNEENVLPISEEAQDSIRRWLETTPYNAENGEYRKHLASHLAGTGDWLLSSAPFRQWHDSNDDGMLWIKGIPGSGKSVIASTLVERLTAEGAPVLFFFFRQIIDANHTPIALLRDWLDQLLAYSPPLQVRLHGYVEDGRELKSFSIHNLWEELKVAIASLPKVYFVVDALDEMDRGNDLFLQQLAKLGSLSRSRFKVIITSRPVASVEMPLRQASILQIRLEDEHVDRDITTYVASRLSGSCIPESQHGMIKQAVPGRANGLFLYAKLAMDAFLKEDADIQEVMKLLPMDLNAIYERLLHEHAQRSQVPHQLQLLILAWVTHASRPLRLLEIAEMIKVSQKMHELGDLKAIKEVVRTACGPLLEILPDETVCVIHHSLTEFLNGTTRSQNESSPPGYPVLSMGATNSLLAQACISYVLQSRCLESVGLPKKEDLGDGDFFFSFSFPTDEALDKLTANQKLFSIHPFLTYALDNWYFHLKKAEDSMESLEEDALSAVEELLSVTNLPRLDMLVYKSHMDSTPLHVTCRWGLSKCLNMFLQQKKFDIDLKDERGDTAMFLAAAAGHNSAVEVLLAHGANPDVPSQNDGCKPLHNAARNNHAGVVALLLAAGVDPLTPKTSENPGRRCGNAPSSVGHTPLMYAVLYAEKEVAAAFMPHLKSSETVSRALAWAAKGGNSDVVRVILQHPLCRVNDKVQGDTPVFVATQWQKLDAAIALLEGGANPSILSRGEDEEYARSRRYSTFPPMTTEDEDTGYNALHALCGATRDSRRTGVWLKDVPTTLIEQCVSLIVKAGIDVNAKNERGNTALQDASEYSPCLVRLLLEAGADTDVEGKDGTTCLHAAKNPEIVQLLVKQGNANIDKKRMSDGKTPLLAAVSNASHGLVSKFLELGADPTMTDVNGQGALHLHLGDQTKPGARASPDVIESLLKAGVPPNSRDHRGQTPLHLLGHPEIYENVVAMFVAAGADPNARDDRGKTPIFNVVASGSDFAMKALETLINVGARLDVLDYEGRNVLFSYVSHKEPGMDRINELVRLGIDPKARDFRGNTLWHAIFEGQPSGTPDEKKTHLEVVKQLGVDVNLVNNLGQSALHLYLARGYYRLPDILGFFKSTIDGKDRNGIRPLHIAVRQSEKDVMTLLAAGASPIEPTYEGMTPLHVAARFRQPNIVGLLLEELKTKLDKAQMLSHLNVPYKKGAPLALHIACRSGLPETVSLLLTAGANPNPSPLTWCLEYEAEEALWEAPKDSSGDSFGILVKDSQRLRTYHSTDVVGRLEEVLETLQAHGTDFTASTADDGRPGLDTAIERSAIKDYTAICLLRLRQRLSGSSSQFENLETDVIALADEAYVKAVRTGDKVPSHSLFASMHRRAATLKVFKEVEPWKTSIIELPLQKLIKEHQWDAIRYWFLHDPKCYEADYHGSSNLSHIIRQGLHSLVVDVFPRESVEQFETAYKALTVNERYIMEPPLQSACGRRQGNLPMLRCLVEKLGVDVDLQHALVVSEIGSRMIKKGPSALHVLASGLYWWQVAEGLPYLISRGANLELRDTSGRTPLLVALESASPLAKRAARILVDAGADVNAINNAGKSCLAWAGNDQDMTKLLVDRGAEVTASALLSVIEKGDADLLDFLCERASPDIRKPGAKPENEKRGGVDSHEMYPLYYAASKRPEEFMDSLGWGKVDPATIKQQLLDRHLPCITVLMKRGADLFVRYGKWVRENEDSFESKYVKAEQTLLHALLEEGGLVAPILELGDLELEHRDARGRTLLLATCRSRLGPDSSIDAVGFRARYKEYSVEDLYTAKPSLVEFFLEKGCCVTVQDNDGQNALHHLLRSKLRGGHKSLRKLLSHAPELVHHVDASGETPLHYALRRYDTFGGPDTEAIEILVEAGADIHLPDAQGNTALHHLGTWLAEKSYRKGETGRISHLFRRFVSLGLPINSRNHKGETPIFSFMSSQGTYRARVYQEGEDERQLVALHMLQEMGADILTVNNEGDTLLHVVASTNYHFHKEEGEKIMIQRFRWLLDQGLDLMRENSGNQTCLDVAALEENEPILKLYQRKA